MLGGPVSALHVEWVTKTKSFCRNSQFPDWINTGSLVNIIQTCYRSMLQGLELLKESPNVA